MRTYFALFLLASGASLVLTPIVRQLCYKFRWLDEPRDARRTHGKAVPRLGGVAIFCSVLVGLLPLLFVTNLFTESLRQNSPRLVVILVPAFLILLLGVYDDLFGLKAPQKFIGLGLISVVFYGLGGRIEVLSIPFVGSVHLPMVLGLVVTVVWIVGIANAFNLIDGMDGLAAGAAVFASLVFLAVSLTQGLPLMIALALVLSGTLIGFLRYNFNPASIFLGDSGALFIGFMLAALSVEGAQKASTAVAVAIPIMAFGLPMLDTGFTMVRRFISGKPLFMGDQEHIHHMLLQRGWSQRKAALVLYSVCAVFGLVALLVRNSEPLTGLVLFVVGVAVVLGIGRLRYHEVDEIRASVRRNVGDRRVRGTNNIKVRRASRRVAKATSLAEVFEGVIEVLEIGEFVHAVIIIGRHGDAAGNEASLNREIEAPVLKGARMRDGMIWWSWTKEGADAEKMSESHALWSLRMPLGNGNGVGGHLNLYRELGKENILLDVNYLCTLFRQEMAQYLERELRKDATAEPTKASGATAG
jgi:UDP-GlcNAc:undecaprenyl-phosphate/decaprenyl-phosphate GlcNAc-1-phosphate transferase